MPFIRKLDFGIETYKPISFETLDILQLVTVQQEPYSCVAPPGKGGCVCFWQDRRETLLFPFVNSLFQLGRKIWASLLHFCDGVSKGDHPHKWR